jgi:hypothetical protein
VDGVQVLSAQRGQVPGLVGGEFPAITRLIKIGNEVYFNGADDNLLPTRKDQAPRT